MMLIVLRLLLVLPFTWNYFGVPAINLSNTLASPAAPSAAPSSTSSSTSVGLTTGTSETLGKTLGEISPIVCQSFTRLFWFVPASCWDDDDVQREYICSQMEEDFVPPLSILRHSLLPLLWRTNLRIKRPHELFSSDEQVISIVEDFYSYLSC